jgi:hypothetical protein
MANGRRKEIVGPTQTSSDTVFYTRSCVVEKLVSEPQVFIKNLPRKRSRRIENPRYHISYGIALSSCRKFRHSVELLSRSSEIWYGNSEIAAKSVLCRICYTCRKLSYVFALANIKYHIYCAVVIHCKVGHHVFKKAELAHISYRPLHRRLVKSLSGENP